MSFGRKPLEVQPPYGRCDRCKGTLDKNVDSQQRTLHQFCAWASGKDYAALAPYLDGTLRGVDASGSY